MELHPPLCLGVIAMEKGAFRSPVTKVADFLLIAMYHLQFILASVIRLHTVTQSNSSISNNQLSLSHLFALSLNGAQSAETIEYTDCISDEG